MRMLSRFTIAFALLSAAVWTSMAWAQNPLAGAAVSDRQLDSVRGGFDAGGGLLASFGIERATYINGQLVAHSQVSIPDVAHITAGQAQALALATSTVNVIQNGPGNVVEPRSFAPGSAATFIQNSLDNQNIQNLTTINATVNTLGAFRAAHLQESLQASAIQGLGH